MEATLLTLGVLLILVGLIGQVKAKEIEVGTKNPFVRIILGLIGVVFVYIALSKSIPPSLFPVSETPTPTPIPTTIAPPTDRPTTPPPPPTTPPPPPTTPPPILSFAEDCLPFVTDSVRLQESGGNWWIVDSGAMLYFGPNESEAQEALNIILHYRMDKQCFVGRPDSSLEYWLVNNGSPVGSYPMEDCISFNLGNIEVVNINGRWKIVDGSHWILDFADVEEEARKSYEILQYYGFDYICFVGRPDASMIYFRR